MFYKVCHDLGDQLLSACMNTNILPPEKRIEYKLGEWVYPKRNHRLFVFASLLEAQSFKEEMGYYHSLFTCEVLTPRVYKRFFNCYKYTKKIARTFDDLLERKMPCFDGQISCSAYLCKGVKLLEKV